MGIYITCINCGEKFELTDAEQRFYKSKNFELPKRCKICRNSKKSKENIEGIFKLGYKRNTFHDNEQLYGSRVSVTGGLSIEHRYIFKIQLKDEIFYIKYDRENKKLYKTKNKQRATAFVWSNDLNNMKVFLEKKFPKAKVILYPISSYSSLMY